MKNTVQIFQLALGLQEPWQIKEVEFTEDKSELHIHIDFSRGAKFKGPDGELYTAYDSVEREWRHLDFFQHTCYLHARVPRVKQSDGKVKTIQVPWARKQSGFTLLFEALAMMLIESEMTVDKAAGLLRVYPQRIWTIFDYWISLAHASDKPEEITEVGFDETSVKKGHQYVTTMVDLSERRVLFATEGKGAECINKSVTYLREKQMDPDQIERVCIDMSPAFISGCGEYLPNAEITFDKFHVVKEVNKAMDELRKAERKGNIDLKGHKYTFLKKKLPARINAERHVLMERYPSLGEGYRLRELFMDFWELKDRSEAETYLAFWCDYVELSEIESFQSMVKLIKKHWEGILNYVESKITNGILEGINSKIQLAKKRARGYRKVPNFINMIYLIAGKLNFNYPQYSI